MFLQQRRTNWVGEEEAVIDGESGNRTRVMRGKTFVIA